MWGCASNYAVTVTFNAGEWSAYNCLTPFNLSEYCVTCMCPQRQLRHIVEIHLPGLEASDLDYAATL